MLRLRQFAKKQHSWNSCHGNFYAQKCKSSFSPFFFLKAMLLLFSTSNLLSSVIFFYISTYQKLVCVPFTFIFLFLSLLCVFLCVSFFSFLESRLFKAFYLTFNYKFIFLIDARKALQDFCECVCKTGFFFLRLFNLPLSSDSCALHSPLATRSS